MLFGLSESVEPTTFSAIYNSLRYDDATRIVTFHLREKDWNKLKSNSRMWMSCSDMNPFINRKMVHLGGEAVKSVVRIDPVEKFGLSSVQTFIVTDASNTNCQVLKALKVEENTLSYFAELEILDSVNCKAKAMKITFQPVNCPSEVCIGFEGAKGDTFNMYFSCSVDEKSSKFQISRARGKVFCRIPKREAGTIGELVVQNPAPIPFHALTLWDAKLHDIRIWKKMFRTKLDLELKKQAKSGSPFFNVRESIAMILNKHVEEPKVPMVYCFEELGIIKEPYNTSDGMARKKGLVVKVQEVYKWKNMPVAKVLFCDCQKFADMLRNASTVKRQLMEAFFSVTWRHLVTGIPVDQQEKSLFRKMLYTNAARVTQDSGSEVWKNSYITLLFPRERSINLLEAAGEFARNMRGFPFNPFHPPETSQSEEDFSPESFSDFLADMLLHQMTPFDTEMDHASVFDPPQWAPPLREPACAFCRSKTGDLKRCTGCKRVFYCNKKCQKHHWKEHKPDCKSTS